MYPHELSGGMKQRVCIAIAISLRPKVIIADEPTSALDVVVQRQVMETLKRVQEELGASVILIGHDMGLMAQFVDRLGVMYAGKLAEVCDVGDVPGAAAPLQPAADRQPADPRSEGRAPGHPRAAALAAEPAARLPLPPALSVGHGPLRGRDPELQAVRPGRLSPAISTTWPGGNARERVGPP